MPVLPYQLLRELPQAFLETRQRLERLIAKESAMPLHKRIYFAGLPGDYQIIDDMGNEIWASEYAHKLFVQTCPRGLHRRATL